MIRRAVLVSALFLVGCASTEIALTQRGNERLTPVTRYQLSSPLIESSGLAEYRGQYWSINDGGNASNLYTWSDATDQNSIPLAESDNFDWEAMAQNDKGLFVVDCGNNRGDRIWLQRYFIGWNELQSDHPIAKRIDFRFGDTDPHLARRKHNNDCEAAAWVEDKLWLFTKNWLDGHTRIYTLDLQSDKQVLTTYAVLPVAGLITGADYNAEYQQLVLLGYGAGLQVLQPFVWFIPVNQQQPVWQQAKRYELDRSGQWEAIVWRDSNLVITREDSMLGGPVMAQISVPSTRLKRF